MLPAVSHGIKEIQQEFTAPFYNTAAFYARSEPEFAYLTPPVPCSQIRCCPVSPAASGTAGCLQKQDTSCSSSQVLKSRVELLKSHKLDSSKARRRCGSVLSSPTSNSFVPLRDFVPHRPIFFPHKNSVVILVRHGREK